MKKDFLVKIGVIGFVFGTLYFFPPTHKKVMELETVVEDLKEQTGYNYFAAVDILERNVEELLRVDYTKELTEKEIREVDVLLQEYNNLTNILFYSSDEKVQLTDWRDKMSEAQDTIFNHIHVKKVTEEEIEGLMQTLEAIRFIARDFRDLRFVDENDGFSLMHSEKSEMIERVKLRLNAKY